MSSNPLSYPALKCVLENLEAVKRFRITARTPSLQKIEKLVPIRMDNFCMTRTELTINKISIDFKPEMVFKYEKTQIRIGHPVKREKAIKKMVEYYLFGRSLILLNQLDSTYRKQGYSADYAANLKLRVNCLNLNDSEDEDFESALLHIHPDSIPLKVIKSSFDKATTSDHPIIKSARTLILSKRSPPQLLEDIKKLGNETIVFEENSFLFGNLSIFEFIRYLKESVPIGKTYIITQSDNYVTTHLSHVKMMYNRYSDPLDRVQERFIPGAPRFLIPINDTSSIQVFGIGKETNERGTDWQCRKKQYEIEADRETKRQRQKVVIKVVSTI